MNINRTRRHLRDSGLSSNLVELIDALEQSIELIEDQAEQRLIDADRQGIDTLDQTVIERQIVEPMREILLNAIQRLNAPGTILDFYISRRGLSNVEAELAKIAQILRP